MQPAPLKPGQRVRVVDARVAEYGMIGRVARQCAELRLLMPAPRKKPPPGLRYVVRFGGGPGRKPWTRALYASQFVMTE